MQTLDPSLFQLVTDGQISLEDALANADSANNLRLPFKLENGEAPDEDQNAESDEVQDAAPKSKSTRGELTLEEIEEDEAGRMSYSAEVWRRSAVR